LSRLVNNIEVVAIRWYGY